MGKEQESHQQSLDAGVIDISQWEIPIDKLYKPCDPAIFHFTGTDELTIRSETIGQDRAVQAIQFGLDIESPGFNIFVMGSTGTGRRTTVQRIVGELARHEAVPDDWIYVHNFEYPGKPQAMHLPPGMGAQFRDDMDSFSTGLADQLAHAFESEQYAAVRRPIEQALQMSNQQELSVVAVASQQAGFTLVNSPSGLYVAPVHNGEIVTSEILSSLPQEQQLKLEQERQRLDNMLNGALRRIRDAERQATMAIQELDREVAGYTIKPLLDELHKAFENQPRIAEYLTAVELDIINNLDRLRSHSGPLSSQEHPSRLDVPLPYRYRVNLFVDNSMAKGAPVITLDAPTYEKLFGFIEYEVRQGVTGTNHTLIRAGALHQANGGYLILDAFSLLKTPELWTGLKRTLFNNTLSVESPDGQGLVRTITPIPENVPLHTKVILHGVPYIYYRLYELDEDFAKLFKVQADFNSRIDRTVQTEQAYAQFIHTLCSDEKLRPFEPEAVARVVEYGIRLAGHQERISMRFGKIADLIRESSYWAGKVGNQRVSRKDVNQGIFHTRYRSSLSEELVLKGILEDTIRVTTTGYAVGQINALMVQSVGGFQYGMPSRISAQVYVGQGSVVSIQREAQMSGPVHNKGVLTLSGYFGGQYGRYQQLSMAASVSMEQVYEGVEGDSASSAELYALISSISGIPCRQDLAVTGAVDQHGQILAIGGVNQKIEGFFKICQARGLTGTQGVIIPVDNVKNLMLEFDVLEAVREGSFHIYGVKTVNEGLSLLTGLPAGICDASGTYTPGSIHASVAEQLTLYSQRSHKKD
ncbi:MAG: AAA family ATPase [Anaerolineae bacterium]|nr:AAA family ATPase [Anaerolineae bacterium]